MTATPKNFHVVLSSRPGESNETTENNFRYEETPYPDTNIPDGSLLIKNLYLSLDPALRSRLNDDTGVDYIGPWEVGSTIDGFGGIGEVVSSTHDGFRPGDTIVCPTFWPWKAYFTVAASTVRKVATEISGPSPTLHLSIFGLTGLTAYIGVKERGHVTKGANQTMVVSAAAGSTGSFAGQIGKALGCVKVVGTCGSDAKVKCLTEELGFDAAINYKTQSVAQRLQEMCPGGVDVYFDNVGGEVSNDVIRQMNKDSHIILCGQISTYNKTKEYPPPIPDEISEILKAQNITRERFLVLAYQDQWESSVVDLMGLYASGRLKVKETVETGLENSGKAFVSMMSGGNIGKQLLKV